jgi:DNA-binding transcriptional MerR regulator
MAEQTEETRITIQIAAQRTGLAPHVVRRCMSWGLVSQTLTETELGELRRVRRLSRLGINLAGIDVILRMRRRIQALQTEIERLEDHV